MKMQYFHCQFTNLVNTKALKMSSSVNQLSSVTGIVRPVNIPVGEAELQKMQASASQLKDIINDLSLTQKSVAGVKRGN